MLVIEGECPGGHLTARFLAVLLKNCEKLAVKHSIGNLLYLIS